MSLYFLNFNFSQLKLSVSDFFVQSCANTFKNTSRKYCHIIHCDSITEKYEARTLFLPNLGLGIILSFKFYFFKNLVNFFLSLSCFGEESHFGPGACLRVDLSLWRNRLQVDNIGFVQGRNTHTRVHEN